jgi:hypothetical protein
MEARASNGTNLFYSLFLSFHFSFILFINQATMNQYWPLISANSQKRHAIFPI